ncbi:MAG TPA: class I SAM-dependent methyltransferase [Gemmatimonadaceae bacterium]|nr:class I SAM-dependent methyltransferase [Gemmatimonadaceae bacterium]
MKSDSKLFCPNPKERPTTASVSRFFENIGAELDLLPSASARLLRTYYTEAGLLGRPFKRGFFQHHFVQNVAKATRTIFDTSKAPRILDLGCGMGTQSIFFAMRGATVIGIDMDSAALRVARQRTALYAEASDRRLNVRFIEADAFQFDFAAAGPVDVIYSLFAFNMIQPTTLLLDRLIPALRPGGLLIVQDGNRKMWFNRIFRRRPVLSAGELANQLEKRGFNMEDVSGLYALPPFVWRTPSIAEPIDRTLRGSELFAGSFLHIARSRE